MAEAVVRREDCVEKTCICRRFYRILRLGCMCDVFTWFFMADVAKHQKCGNHCYMFL